MTQMTYEEFVESEEFENYVQDLDAWRDLPQDLQAQVAGTGANILGITITDDKNLQDVEDIDTGDYPEAAVENAQMALDAKEETGNPNDCGTQVGWERANQLVNGEDLSEDTIGRMSNFARHEDNKEQGEEGRGDCGWLMWKAWGGDEGIAWAEDKIDEFDNARENSAHNHRCLGGPTERDKEHLPEWDQSLLSMQQAVTQPDMPGDKHLVSVTDNTTPQFVLDRIRDALLQGNIFTEIESIAASDRDQLREYMLETLTDERGWTLDGLTDQLQQIDGLENRDDAERVARTETTNILNSSRHIAYEEQGKTDKRFYWTGALDGRTTDTCAYLQNGFDADLENPGAFNGLRRPDGTDPFEGGTPMPLEELQEHIKEVAQADPEINTQPRQWTPHINCRSTFILEPDAGI